MKYIVGQRCEILYHPSNVGSPIEAPIYDENNIIITDQTECETYAKAIYNTENLTTRLRPSPSEIYYLPATVDTETTSDNAVFEFNVGSFEYNMKKKVLRTGELVSAPGFLATPQSPYGAFGIKFTSTNLIYPHNNTNTSVCSNINFQRYSDFFGVCNGNPALVGPVNKFYCAANEFVYTTALDGVGPYCATGSSVNSTIDVDPGDGSDGSIIAQNCVLDRTGENMFDAFQSTVASPSVEAINFSTDSICFAQENWQ